MAGSRPGGTAEAGRYARELRRMTPEVLAAICEERHMWSQPHLNTQLFLNYKGFDAIEGLEDYTKVRTLHLGNNNIARIEGLDRMSDLRSLHLESNRIARIENLLGNVELRQLNLEGNGIKRVEGLSHLLKLEQINLAKNNISCLEDLEELRSAPGLVNVDVSHNQLDAAEGVIEFWSGIAAQLKVLRYHGNPGIRNIQHYRKRLVNALSGLTYLDERPVAPVERRACAAWAEGGLEAMHQAKRDFHEEQRRAQNYIDPERREHLTRMRKAAIARIEREAKEREELEAARAKASSSSAPSPEGLDLVQSGDLQALGEYEKSWQTKVNLHGLDGVRAQVARDMACQSGAAAPPPPTASAASHGPAPQPHRHGECQKPPPEFAYDFRPPVRAGHAQELGRLGGRPAGASSFIAPSTDCGGDIADRQFAVLGDDPWAGRSVGSSASSGAGRPGRASRAEPEIMPQIWERLAPASKAAELQALEQNFSHLSLGAGSAECASASLCTGRTGALAASGGDELSVLD